MSSTFTSTHLYCLYKGLSLHTDICPFLVTSTQKRAKLWNTQKMANSLTVFFKCLAVQRSQSHRCSTGDLIPLRICALYPKKCLAFSTRFRGLHILSTQVHVTIPKKCIQLVQEFLESLVQLLSKGYLAWHMRSLHVCLTSSSIKTLQKIGKQKVGINVCYCSGRALES